VKAQRIYIFKGPVNNICVCVHRFTSREKDYRLHTKTRKEKEHRKKLLIFFNSPHNIVVSIFIYDDEEEEKKKKKKKKKSLSFYITCYYFEKLINRICFFVFME
jgi:DNA polymerase III delta subunit